LKPTPGKNFMIPYLKKKKKKKITKKGWWKAQAVDLEFKPQHHTHTHKKTKTKETRKLFTV
jgi:hypothetical protein